LGRVGLYVPNSEREVVASFDPRFRGHTDGMVNDTRLLEIKSVNPERFKKVRAHGIPLSEHYAQVQMYLRHGGFPDAMILYVDVATYEHYPIFVVPDAFYADLIDDKIKRVLAAIDTKTPPRCECGYCLLDNRFEIGND